MANKYLAREDAPFESAVWELLDATMKEVAKSQVGTSNLRPKNRKGID